MVDGGGKIGKREASIESAFRPSTERVAKKREATFPALRCYEQQFPLVLSGGDYSRKLMITNETTSWIVLFSEHELPGPRLDHVGRR